MKNLHFLFTIFLSMLVVVWLAGCVTTSSAKKEFDEARQQNRASSYRSFISTYPNHELSSKAKKLHEKALFKEANEGNKSFTAYLQYKRFLSIYVARLVMLRDLIPYNSLDSFCKESI